MPVVNANRSVVTPLSTIKEQRLDSQLKQLEFNALLHRKLDLALLFECFLSEGQGFVRFDGIQFIAYDRSMNLLLGDVRQHRQRFELKLGDRVLGDVLLMRGKAFDVREERDSEKLVESLIYPLDNALTHQKLLLQSMTDKSTGFYNQRALDLSYREKFA